MIRKEIKNEAKSLLNSNFPFFIQLFLISFLLTLVTGFPIYHFQDNTPDAIWTTYDSVATLASVLLSVFIVSAQYASLDALRNSNNITKPFEKSLVIFNKGDIFAGTVITALLTFVFTCLWTLLFVIPGIIKGLAYSQALFIYRDHINNNDPIKYTEAITLSRKLMTGHKWEYFVFQLSFLGYWLLTLVTFGLFALWLMPYYRLANANYYNHLLTE